MPVFGFRLRIGFQPLLQTPVGADLVGCKASALVRQLAAQLPIQAQDLRGANHVAEQLAQ